MPKRRNLNGVPHNLTKIFFGTERYYIKGYMGDWLSNAATRLNLKNATLNVMTGTFQPDELNLAPLIQNAKDLKSIIHKELRSNGFELDFIVEASIYFEFSESTFAKRKICCFPFMIDKDGHRYDSGKIIEDVFEIHFDPFHELRVKPSKHVTFLTRLRKLFG